MTLKQATAEICEICYTDDYEGKDSEDIARNVEQVLRKLLEPFVKGVKHCGREEAAEARALWESMQ